MTQSFKASLAWIIECLKRCLPRAFRLQPRDERPTLLYTDGWGEPSTKHYRIGGVIDSPRADSLLFFGADVPAEVIADLLPKAQHIGQVELLAGPVSLDAWAPLLHEAHAIHFVDNDSAAVALVKGYSSREDSLTIVADYWLRCLDYQCAIFVDRVESASNLADEPSRPPGGGGKSHRAALQAQCVKPLLNVFQQGRPARGPFRWYPSRG